MLSGQIPCHTDLSRTVNNRSWLKTWFDFSPLASADLKDGHNEGGGKEEGGKEETGNALYVRMW